MTQLKNVGFICLFYLSEQKNKIVVEVKFGGVKNRENLQD